MKNKIKKSIFIFFVSIIITSSAFADGAHPSGITLDGTIGAAGEINLNGPDFQINAEYGEQAGANLFHSFNQFNIHENESATFSGPPTVLNIISRITGGDASWLNGKIACSITGANLFLINSSGIMFGPCATLDIGGSFFVSTADFLRFKGDEFFYSRPVESEELSISPPSAFGFIDDDVAPISYYGMGEITEEEWNLNDYGLQVSPRESISIISGDIILENGIYSDNSYSHEDISAPGGRIDLISVAAKGEVALPGLTDDIDLSSFEQLGNISISGKITISTKAAGSGDIYIRGGSFVAVDSIIDSDTLGSVDGGVIDIQADTVIFDQGAALQVNTYGTGNGSDIKIKSTGSLQFSGENNTGFGSSISMMTLSGEAAAGNGGSLLIEAGSVFFIDGAYIISDTYGPGKGSDITINSSGQILFSGEDSYGIVSSILAGSQDKGDAGSLTITGESIVFDKGAYIDSIAYDSGSGGDISLIASDSIVFSGEDSDGLSSTIEAATFLDNEMAGNAGSVFLKADTIIFEDGAHINSDSYGAGVGSDVIIKASKSLTFSGESSLGSASSIYVSSFSNGDAGSLTIESNEVGFFKGAFIDTTAYSTGRGGDIVIKGDHVEFSGEDSSGTGSCISLESQYEYSGAGDGGNLLIESRNIVLAGGGYINSTTYGTGSGGYIEIKSVGGNIALAGATENGDLSGFFSQSQFSGTDAGNSGNISVETENIKLEDGAGISATTFGQGDAGNIDIKVSGSVSMILESFISSASYEMINGGDAGSVSVSAVDSVFMSGNSSLTTESQDAGGGIVNVLAGNILYLSDSEITSSVMSGQGRGGDVNINAKTAVLNKSEIIANAVEGDGGAIFIATENYLKSGDSTVSATSKRGNDGVVEIETPDLDVGKDLSVMPHKFINAEKWMKKPCIDRTASNASSLVIHGRDAAFLPRGDFLPGFLAWRNIKGAVSSENVLFRKDNLNLYSLFENDLEKNFYPCVNNCYK